MQSLPSNPIMLASAINSLLRDGEYDSLDDLCASFDRDPAEITKILAAAGYVYLPEIKQFR